MSTEQFDPRKWKAWEDKYSQAYDLKERTIFEPNKLVHLEDCVEILKKQRGMSLWFGSKCMLISADYVVKIKKNSVARKLFEEFNGDDVDSQHQTLSELLTLIEPEKDKLDARLKPKYQQER